MKLIITTCLLLFSFTAKGEGAGRAILAGLATDAATAAQKDQLNKGIDKLKESDEHQKKADEAAKREDFATEKAEKKEAERLRQEGFDHMLQSKALAENAQKNLEAMKKATSINEATGKYNSYKNAAKYSTAAQSVQRNFPGVSRPEAQVIGSNLVPGAAPNSLQSINTAVKSSQKFIDSFWATPAP